MSKKFFLNLKKSYIIAEIGVNHNNNLNLAKKLIIQAKKIGADAVKFQTFTAKKLVKPGTRKVKYQKNSEKDNETHYDLIKKLELSEKHHKLLKNFTENLKIDFISTPYDVTAARFLNKLGLKIYKTASADLHDFELHEYLAKSKKRVIISTGMSTLEEVKKTVKIYKKYKNSNIALLHCTSNYPCSVKSINLLSMLQLKKIAPIIGYSDHSKGNLATTNAIALGAKIIEKHFTLDKSLKGPDHKASADVKEFEELVRKIRETEALLGSKVKRIQPEELEMRKISKKGLYFGGNFEKGDKIKKTDILNIRPANKFTSFDIKNFDGLKLKKKS